MLQREVDLALAYNSSVLLISSDTVGSEMAGSGIRYWNLARVLGAHLPVTLAVPTPTDLDPPTGVTIVAYGGAEEDESARGEQLATLVTDHEVVVGQHLPYLYTEVEILEDRYLVVDLYAPWILEKLEYARTDPERGEANRADDVEIMNRLLSLGDFFLCASERQRDFWLGALAGAGRLELAHIQADPELRSLIDVVPFGLPERRPMKNGTGPRELYEIIGPSDPVLLWNGGLWNWLDPLTAIRATGLLAKHGVAVRLVFMGTQSPVSQVAEMGVVEDARLLAEELELLNNHVFFHDWVAYDERQNWLFDADVTLSLHEATIEARYAYRTRILDNLWCDVPMIATEGDILADFVRDEGIGLTVPPGDAVAVSSAVEQVLEKATARAMRSRLATVASQYTWEQVSEPLLKYCQDPWRMGIRRGLDAEAEYVQKLERLYTETAQYAQDLERAIAEKNRALEGQAQQQHPATPFIARIFGDRGRS